MFILYQAKHFRLLYIVWFISQPKTCYGQDFAAQLPRMESNYTLGYTKLAMAQELYRGRISGLQTGLYFHINQSGHSHPKF